ncbi:MAG: succinate dehydrogenase assembly factor 2 [Proteobacteria bacterium]|nr:succinate dehydrogenase assembly factor 2 [Pseudomonadota bacterium]
MAGDIETLRKILFYRSWYRGCKETDILLGRFARQNLEQLNEIELQEYATLLEESDNDIFAWITGQQPIPECVSSKLIAQITAFHQSA